MNAHGNTKRCAGRVYCHSAAAADGLHRTDTVNAGAVRHHGHAQRSMRAGASEVCHEAANAPPPVALWVSGIVRWGQAHVPSGIGGHICADRARHGVMLGHPITTHEPEVGENTRK